MMEKAYQEECGLKCQAVVDGYSDFIFINRFGNVQHQGTLNKALRRIIRDCNYEVLDKNNSDDVVILPSFSNHSLRHTFTTRMCEAGVNIKAMQDILGHADAETTLQPLWPGGWRMPCAPRPRPPRLCSPSGGWSDSISDSPGI